MKLSSSVYVGQHEGGSLVHWRSKCRSRASQGALSSLTAYCCLCNLKFRLPEESIFNNGSNGEIGRENSRKLSYAYQLVLVWSDSSSAAMFAPRKNWVSLIFSCLNLLQLTYRNLCCNGTVVDIINITTIIHLSFSLLFSFYLKLVS